MKITILLLISTLLLSCFSAVAQQPPPLEPVKPSDFVNAKPANCEYLIAVLDGITQKTPADESIIVIARLGDGDTRANLNRRRLHNVRAYWTEFLSEGYRRKRETIILAEGEKVRGFGQLEFYVGGKLVYIMKVARNSDLHVGECYPPDDSYIRNGVFNPCEVKSNKIFYPCRNENVRRRGKR